MAKKITAQQAYKAHIDHQLKIEKQISRGLWSVNSCPDCNGTGKQQNHLCYTCGGEQDNYTPVERELNSKQVEL